MSCEATDVQTEMDVEGPRIVEFTTQEAIVPLTEMLLNTQELSPDPPSSVPDLIWLWLTRKIFALNITMLLMYDKVYSNF